MKHQLDENTTVERVVFLELTKDIKVGSIISLVNDTIKYVVAHIGIEYTDEQLRTLREARFLLRSIEK